MTIPDTPAELDSGELVSDPTPTTTRESDEASQEPYWLIVIEIAASIAGVAT